MLDEAEATVPGDVRQFAECLLEAGPVVHVCAKVDGHQKVIERTDDLIVCICLDVLGVRLEAGEGGITVGHEFRWDFYTASANNQRRSDEKMNVHDEIRNVAHENSVYLRCKSQ